MSQNQFEVLLAAIHTIKGDMNKSFNSIDARFNSVEGRLDKIEGELKRIEYGTQYNANQDIVKQLAIIANH